jgi:hypothetical protein
MKLLELEWAEARLSIEDPQAPPGGPMVPYLGQQLALEEITRYYEGRQGIPLDLTNSLLRVLRSIRSFPVIPLQGVQVICRPDDFDLQIPSLYAEHLPSVNWFPSFNQKDGFTGLIEKYHLLDVAYVGAFDAATKQTMMLELGGRVSGLDGALEHRQTFPETVVVTITHAHWANVSGLGIGVGFYS